MKKQIIILDVICGDKFTNDFMHYADVFEPGKQLGTYHNITIKGEGIKIADICSNMKKALEKVGQNVTFIGISSINGRKLLNPMGYIKPKVQTISDGKNWCLFKSILEQLGYEVTTSEQMHVEIVKSKKNKIS